MCTIHSTFFLIKHPQFLLFPYDERQSLTPTQTTNKIRVLCILICRQIETEDTRCRTGKGNDSFARKGGRKQRRDKKRKGKELTAWEGGKL